MDIFGTYNCRSVDEFVKIAKIGEGTYGSVYKARDKRSGEIVAVKRIKMLDQEKEGLPVTSLREISILRQEQRMSAREACPNIVQLKDVVVGHRLDMVFLVFEYCEFDLSSLRKSKHFVRFKESEVKCLMTQLLRAMDHLHKRHIVHRDIKMSNLLYTSQGVLKLADFGMARNVAAPGKPMTPGLITLWYRAPEVLLGTDIYTTSVDMWSVGCIFAELLLNKPLMAGKSELAQLRLIFELLGAPSEQVWPGFSNLPMARKIKIPPRQEGTLRAMFRPILGRQGFDLLSRLLCYDPRQRLTAAQALNHPYFSEKPLPQSKELMPTFAIIHKDHS